MVYYLIVCRSLTYAQRTASALERAVEVAQSSDRFPLLYGTGSTSAIAAGLEENDVTAIVAHNAFSAGYLAVQHTAALARNQSAMIYLDGAAWRPPKTARHWLGGFIHQWGAWQPLAAAGMFPAMQAAETAFLCRQAASSFEWRAQNGWCSSSIPHGLNLAIHSYLKPGDTVVISAMSTTPSPDAPRPWCPNIRVAAGALRSGSVAFERQLGMR